MNAVTSNGITSDATLRGGVGVSSPAALGNVTDDNAVSNLFASDPVPVAGSPGSTASALSVLDPVLVAGSSDNVEGESTAEGEVPELRQRNGALKPRRASTSADRAEAAAKRAEVAAEKARAENAAIAAALEEVKAELAQQQQASAHRDLVASIEAERAEDEGTGDNDEGSGNDDEACSEANSNAGSTVYRTQLLEELAASHPLTARQEERLSKSVSDTAKTCNDLCADAKAGGTRLGELLKRGALRDRRWLPSVFVGAGGDQLSRGQGLRFLLKPPAAWLTVAGDLANHFDEGDQLGGNINGQDRLDGQAFTEDDRALLEQFYEYWDGLMRHIIPGFKGDVYKVRGGLPESLFRLGELLSSLHRYLGL